MIAAVLTLTRDRLDYTIDCFEALRRNAGIEFHHYVLDQGSQDATPRWLESEKEKDNLFYVDLQDHNLGIAPAMNRLVDAAVRFGGYDAIVKFDNDCMTFEPFTLKRAVACCTYGNTVLSPIVDGLNTKIHPFGVTTTIGNERIKILPMIGGIFMATSMDVWTRFRYPDDLPPWGGDDAFICGWAKHEGMTVGYIEGLRVQHYETTNGQHERYPEYFARRVEEGGPE